MSEAMFAIDLARCTGCLTCVVACNDRAMALAGPETTGPPKWLVVETRETGAYPRPELVFYVTHCFHCEHPACAEVCPVEAISREDGVVALDDVACIGCGVCIDACPFGAITQRPTGTATKCDGCADEVAQGREPTCVRACPMRALAYGETATPPVHRVMDDGFDDHDLGPRVVYWRRPSGIDPNPS